MKTINKELISDNILIAKFMNGTCINYANNTKGWIIPNLTNNGIDGDERNLKFNSDWNWLMMVIEKIEKTKGVTVQVAEVGCRILLFGKDIAMTHSDTKIQAVYGSVVKYINYYNEINNKNIKVN